MYVKVELTKKSRGRNPPGSRLLSKALANSTGKVVYYAAWGAALQIEWHIAIINRKENRTMKRTLAAITAIGLATGAFAEMVNLNDIQGTVNTERTLSDGTLLTGQLNGELHPC